MLPRIRWSASVLRLIPFLEHDDANRASDGLEHDGPGCAVGAP